MILTNMPQRTLAALGAGAAGAATLTLIHQAARGVTPAAPRMDRLGAESLARIIRRTGRRPPKGWKLQRLALAADVASNTLYYAAAFAGRPRRALLRGAIAGALAGVGAVLLPGPLGLDARASSRSLRTAVMAFGWYLAGGLATGVVWRALR